MLRVCRHLTARSKFIQHLFRRRRQPRVLRRPRRSRRRRRAHRRHRSSSQRRRPRFPRRRPRLRRSPLILQIHVRSHRQRRRVLCVPLNLRPLPDAVFRHPRRERPRLRLAPRPVQFTTLLPILHRVDTHTHTHTQSRQSLVESASFPSASPTPTAMPRFAVSCIRRTSVFTVPGTVPMSTKPSRDVFIPALTVFFAIFSRRRPSRRRLSRRRTNARMRGGPGTEPDGHYCLHIVPRVMTGEHGHHPRTGASPRSAARSIAGVGGGGLHDGS